MKDNFEENLTKLETIVNELEKGNVPLDDAIKKYTEAMEYAKNCSEKLKKAQEQVNKIVTEMGTIETFDEEQA